jgi:hypothetical protein
VPQKLADGDRPGRHADSFTCMVSLFVPSDASGLYLMADAAGYVSIYDQSA